MSMILAPKQNKGPKPGSWSESASSAVVLAFGLFFNRQSLPLDEDAQPQSPIRMLTTDILVDEIFPFLLIDELIRLRKTCKAFYLLTHETVIWKRYLRRLKIPIALLRPTFEYDKRISNYEIETLVTSACAIECAWRGGIPRIRQERVLTSQCQVVDLCLLPGGKFLVASIKDRSNYRFFILVYALDVLNGSRMIARVPTFYKAFDLQAKYVTYDERPGIMIYYTRRRFSKGVPKNHRDNINEYHHRVRYPTDHAMTYDALCIHMRLDSVEKLIYPEFNPSSTGVSQNYAAHARKLPAPFVDVYHRATECEIHSPSLCMVNNDPVLWFAEDSIRGSEIVYTNLLKGHGGTCRILCEDSEGFERLPHRIRAMRYLPIQKCILVIRSVRVTPDSNDTILCEIYDLPRSSGDHRTRAYKSWSFEDKWDLTNEFTISDDADFTGNTAYHPDLVNHRYKPPPTIWIFAPSQAPNAKGCVYFYLRPGRDEYRRWRYMEMVDPRVHRNVRGNYERALPGSLRSLILEVDSLYSPTKLTKMRRFFFSEYRFPDAPAQETTEEEYENQLLMSMRDHPIDVDRALIDIVCSEDVGYSVNKAGGLVAAAWDEMSGKICVAAEDDNCIRVLDVAPVVEPHLRLAYRWHTNLVDPDIESADYVPLEWPSSSSSDHGSGGSESGSGSGNTSGDVEMLDATPQNPKPSTQFDWFNSIPWPPPNSKTCLIGII